MRLVPLRDVEEDVLEPIVRRILVFIRLVFFFAENLKKASEEHPAWVSFL